MYGNPFEDNHVYIDMDDAWEDDLLDLFLLQGTPWVSVVTTLQTEGTLWCRIHDRHIMMHPRDRRKLLTARYNAFAGDWRSHFTNGL